MSDAAWRQRLPHLHFGRFDFECNRVHFYRLHVVKGIGVCWRGRQIEVYR